MANLEQRQSQSSQTPTEWGGMFYDNICGWIAYFYAETDWISNNIYRVYNLAMSAQAALL